MFNKLWADVRNDWKENVASICMAVSIRAPPHLFSFRIRVFASVGHHRRNGVKCLFFFRCMDIHSRNKHENKDSFRSHRTVDFFVVGEWFYIITLFSFYLWHHGRIIICYHFLLLNKALHSRWSISCERLLVYFILT